MEENRQMCDIDTAVTATRDAFQNSSTSLVELFLDHGSAFQASLRPDDCDEYVKRLDGPTRAFLEAHIHERVEAPTKTTERALINWFNKASSAHTACAWDVTSVSLFAHFGSAIFAARFLQPLKKLAVRGCPWPQARSLLLRSRADAGSKQWRASIVKAALARYSTPDHADYIEETPIPSPSSPSSHLSVEQGRCAPPSMTSDLPSSADGDDINPPFSSPTTQRANIASKRRARFNDNIHAAKHPCKRHRTGQYETSDYAYPGSVGAANSPTFAITSSPPRAYSVASATATPRQQRTTESPDCLLSTPEGGLWLRDPPSAASNPKSTSGSSTLSSTTMGRYLSVFNPDLQAFHIVDGSQGSHRLAESPEHEKRILVMPIRLRETTDWTVALVDRTRHHVDICDLGHRGSDHARATAVREYIADTLPAVGELRSFNIMSCKTTMGQATPYMSGVAVIMLAACRMLRIPPPETTSSSTVALWAHWLRAMTTPDNNNLVVQPPLVLSEVELPIRTTADWTSDHNMLSTLQASRAEALRLRLREAAWMRVVLVTSLLRQKQHVDEREVEVVRSKLRDLADVHGRTLATVCGEEPMRWIRNAVVSLERKAADFRSIQRSILTLERGIVVVSEDEAALRSMESPTLEPRLPPILFRHPTRDTNDDLYRTKTGCY